MKKLFVLILFGGGVLFFAASAMGATSYSVGPIQISAVVDDSTTLRVVLVKNSPTGAVVDAMNFGTLQEFDFLNATTHLVSKTLRSSINGSTGTGAVMAWITANTHGTPYSILSTGTALTSGTNSIPTGACTVVPVFAAQDNGGISMPSGAALGVAGTWVANEKVLYHSELGTASMATIQAYYSITDDSATGATTAVLVSQPSGTYTGTVTITVTT